VRTASSDDEDIRFSLVLSPNRKEVKFFVIAKPTESIKASMSIFRGRALEGKFVALVKNPLEVISPIWGHETLIDIGIRKDDRQGSLRRLYRDKILIHTLHHVTKGRMLQKKNMWHNTVVSAPRGYSALSISISSYAL